MANWCRISKQTYRMRPYYLRRLTVCCSVVTGSMPHEMNGVVELGPGWRYVATPRRRFLHFAGEFVSGYGLAPTGRIRSVVLPSTSRNCLSKECPHRPPHRWTGRWCLVAVRPKVSRYRLFAPAVRPAGYEQRHHHGGGGRFMAFSCGTAVRQWGPLVPPTTPSRIQCRHAPPRHRCQVPNGEQCRPRTPYWKAGGGCSHPVTNRLNRARFTMVGIGLPTEGGNKA